MLDSYKREINYLRISVTDRCNLRCRYCMPSEGFRWIPHENILRFEEIIEIVREAVKLGIHKIRVTGGEPLLRKGIVNLIEMLASIEGVQDLSMTTNGTHLEKFARELKQAGLQRINISLDTVNAERYAYLTGGGNIERVLRGIDAALEAELTPIKLNCVIQHNSNEIDARTVTKFANQKGLEIRYIHQMNLAEGIFSAVEGGDGGHCEQCNRLRLTADGFIKPCLFSDLRYEVRQLGARNALLETIRNKPKEGTTNRINYFYNIGG
ncbi:MAG: radical SAM protein [Bacteroidales bacterium]|nr:radical SAM protein [Bacteroidales bacterium]HOU35528.1 radical SAM protein [Bacteroidales bacterium]HQI64681.1 radical SAM protein [Bacteroidales bacterium]